MRTTLTFQELADFLGVPRELVGHITEINASANSGVLYVEYFNTDENGRRIVNHRGELSRSYRSIPLMKDSDPEPVL